RQSHCAGHCPSATAPNRKAFMSNIPQNLKYTKDHEWLLPEADGTARIGITDYAQSSLGDVTFVELPSVGDELEAGDTFGVVESVKAASDLYMPVSGEIIAINTDLEGEPQRVNDQPYSEGWVIRIKLKEPSQLENLLDSGAYAEIVG